jgi:hypothetical protein
MTIGRNRGGDLASQRAAALGISRATWFRRVKQGLIEKPAPPPNEAERRKAWNLRRLERRRAQNAADQTAFARMLETLKLPPTKRLESQNTWNASQLAFAALYFEEIEAKRAKERLSRH